MGGGWRKHWGVGRLQSRNDVAQQKVGSKGRLYRPALDRLSPAAPAGAFRPRVVEVVGGVNQKKEEEGKQHTLTSRHSDGMPVVRLKKASQLLDVSQSALRSRRARSGDPSSLPSNSKRS